MAQNQEKTKEQPGRSGQPAQGQPSNDPKRQMSPREEELKRESDRDRDRSTEERRGNREDEEKRNR